MFDNILSWCNSEQGEYCVETRGKEIKQRTRGPVVFSMNASNTLLRLGLEISSDQIKQMIERFKLLVEENIQKAGKHGKKQGSSGTGLQDVDGVAMARNIMLKSVVLISPKLTSDQIKEIMPLLTVFEKIRVLQEITEHAEEKGTVGSNVIATLDETTKSIRQDGTRENKNNRMKAIGLMTRLEAVRKGMAKPKQPTSAGWSPRQSLPKKRKR